MAAPHAKGAKDAKENEVADLFEVVAFGDHAKGAKDAKENEIPINPNY